MTVFLNGKFVPEAEATVSVFDRGFLYGDGLFETMRVLNGCPFCWPQHLQRLESGAEFLKIRMPFTVGELRQSAAQLILVNQMPDALLRLLVTRGVGARGYSPRGAEHPSVVMSLHPLQASRGGESGTQPAQPWRLITSSVRLPSQDPLSQFKTCNKLPQILARAQADLAQADEALLLNTDGWVAEGASSNLFWIQDGRVFTAPLSSGILPGVTRAVILALCRRLGLDSCEDNIRPEALLRTDGAFLSLSSMGVIEAGWLDEQPLSTSPLTAKLSAVYSELLDRETGSKQVL